MSDAARFRSGRIRLSRGPRRFIRFAMRAAAMVLLATTGVVGAWAAAVSRLAEPSASRMVETWDTVAVWGPHTFATPTGSNVTHVEIAVVAVNPDARYELKIEKGNAAGDSLPSLGKVYFNNNWVTGLDAMGANQTVYRVVQPTDTSQVKVEVGGDAGDFMRVTLLSQPDKSYTIFGPQDYVRGSGSPAFEADTFVKSLEWEPPYRLPPSRASSP